jgi:hypothetical protein
MLLLNRGKLHEYGSMRDKNTARGRHGDCGESGHKNNPIATVNMYEGTLGVGVLEAPPCRSPGLP